ncbi:MAG: Holliday junction resolvase RuvX [Gammaproteobacteria bacterium]|nr:MAG: Holliday junction resolvase RuvX [Gammaproteobacteria bacterium]
MSAALQPRRALPGTVLAFDYGRRRIGVAVGQAPGLLLTGRASPLATVPVGPAGPDWAAIQALARQWRPEALVVGLPGGEGRAHPLAAEVRGFARGLRRRLGLPVHLVEETLSSWEAARRLQGRPGAGGRRPWSRAAKARLDREAACLILETWLAEARGEEGR